MKFKKYHSNNKKEHKSKDERFIRHSTFHYPNENLLFSSLDSNVFKELKLEDIKFSQRQQEKVDSRRKRNIYTDGSLTNDDFHEEQTLNEIVTSSENILKKKEKKLQIIDKQLDRRDYVQKLRSNSLNSVENIIMQRAVSIIQNRYDLDFPMDNKKLSSLNLARELENGRDLEERQLDFKIYSKMFLDKNVSKSECLVEYKKFNTAFQRRLNVLQVKNPSTEVWRDIFLSKKLYKKKLQPLKTIELPSEEELISMNKIFCSFSNELIKKSSRNIISTILSLNGARIIIDEHDNNFLIGITGIIIYSTISGCYIAASSGINHQAELVNKPTQWFLKYIPWMKKMKFRILNVPLSEESKKNVSNTEWIVHGNWVKKYWESMRKIYKS